MTAKKILIIDDEAHMRRVTELSLKKGGFELVFGADGDEAVALALATRPDLIVLDVLMPKVDGFTALKQIKQNPAIAAIPVIMLTSRGHHMTRQEAEDCGASLFLTKPFSPTQLLAEARRLLSDAP